jgi:iron-sulfur cluster assembly accessory protein
MSSVSTSEAVIGLTPAAVEQIKAMQEQPDNAGKALRVYVEKGGCSGMQYGLVFDEHRDGDLITEQGGVTALVDAFSADYVRGSVVDFSEDLVGGGFKITNPKAKQSCGCGKSFET